MMIKRVIFVILFLILVFQVLFSYSNFINIKQIVQLTFEKKDISPFFSSPQIIEFERHTSAKEDQKYSYNIKSKKLTRLSALNDTQEGTVDNVLRKQLFNGQKKIGNMLLSNDKKVLAYEVIASNNSINRSVWLMNLSDKSTRPLIGSPTSNIPFEKSPPSLQNSVQSFSFDSKYLLVYQGTGNVDDKYYVIDVMNGNKEILPKPKNKFNNAYSSASWSPNSYQIVYLIEEDKYSGPDYYYGDIYLVRFNNKTN